MLLTYVSLSASLPFFNLHPNPRFFGPSFFLGFLDLKVLSLWRGLCRAVCLPCVDILTAQTRWVWCCLFAFLTRLLHRPTGLVLSVCLVLMCLLYRSSGCGVQCTADGQCAGPDRARLARGPALLATGAQGFAVMCRALLYFAVLYLLMCSAMVGGCLSC